MRVGLSEGGRARNKFEHRFYEIKTNQKKFLILASPRLKKTLSR